MTMAGAGGSAQQAAQDQAAEEQLLDHGCADGQDE